MSHVATQNPFGNPRNPQVTLPSRDNSVSQQMNAVLGALATLGNVRMTLREVEAAGGKNDGGAVMSVEASLITACDRLDRMLSEDSRWGVETLGRLEQRMLELYGQQTQMFEAQTRLANRFDAPQATMRPELRRMADGNWAAISGDPNSINSVIGIGATPAAALNNFDEVFRGGAVNLPKEYLEKYEQQRKAVDGNRTGDSQSPPERQRPPGARRAVKPRPGASEEKTMASEKRKRKSRKLNKYGY